MKRKKKTGAFDWLKLLDISDSARILYILMRKLSQRTEVCYARVATLATMTKKSPQYTRKLLRQLEEAALIKGKPRKHCTTLYSFMEIPKRFQKDSNLFLKSFANINTFSINNQEEESSLNILSSYEENILKLTHESRRERFLFFLLKKEEEVDPRTLLEGLIDGLGHSDEEIEEMVGYEKASQLTESRSRLIIGYRALDREKANAFIRTLLFYSWDRYFTYPKMMVKLANKVSLGSHLEYLKIKAEVIENLVECSDKSHTGTSLKTINDFLYNLCQSCELPKINLSIVPKCMEN